MREVDTYMNLTLHFLSTFCASFILHAYVKSSITVVVVEGQANKQQVRWQLVQ